MTQHIIDTDVDVPKSVRVCYSRGPDREAKLVKHQKMGKVNWNPKNVRHNLSRVERLILKLSGKKVQVLNLNIAKYLQKHPELIPEEWKGSDCNVPKMIPIWGTQYDDEGKLIIYYLLFIICFGTSLFGQLLRLSQGHVLFKIWIPAGIFRN